MLGEFTCPEGFTYIAYSSGGYLDYGLAIKKEDYVLFNSPCELSFESYGATYSDDEKDLEGKPWKKEEWESALRDIYMEGSYDYYIEEYKNDIRVGDMES